MKLLFDQNLSHKLVDSLSDLFPNSNHVRTLGLEESDDLDIWELAKAENYMIVSKDSDFHQYSFLFGPPPKVVWISRGSCSFSEIETILRTHKKDSEASFLEIS